MLNEYYVEQFKNIPPSTNPNFQSKISVEFKRLLLHMFTAFGRKMEATADIWASRLVKSNKTINEVRTAVDVTVASCARLPSYSEFTDILRANSDRESPEEKNAKFEESKIKKFQAETALRREAFIERYSEAKLLEMLSEWHSGVYGSDFTDYFPLGTFAPIFLQDLHQAGGNLEKAIVIGRGKA